MKTHNIFNIPPGKMPGEVFSAIFKSGRVEIERIVSLGHRSPPGFWYDQDFDEWVLILRGAALLRMAGSKRKLRLDEGDYILIPARKRHRVEWTRPDAPTIWLAVRLRPAAGSRRPAKRKKRRG